jgi:hypothetical protein
MAEESSLLKMNLLGENNLLISSILSRNNCLIDTSNFSTNSFENTIPIYDISVTKNGSKILILGEENFQ